MANVEKHKQDRPNGGQQLQRTEQKPEMVRAERSPVATRDPFELMRDFMRLDPFRSDWLFRDPFREMREMMRDFWAGAPEGRERVWRPDFEVRETDNEYIVRGDVPGLAAEALDVTVTGDRLQISGKREQTQDKEEGQYKTYERAYGSFARSFEIPDEVDADKIQCKLDNGVLEVVLPKKPGLKPARRKIEIKSGQDETH